MPFNEDMTKIGSELQEEISQSLVNANKKLINLKLANRDAMTMIHLILVNAWSGWLSAMPPIQRADMFASGTSLIADDLLKQFQMENQNYGPKTN